jgi:hypothetical protein
MVWRYATVGVAGFLAANVSLRHCVSCASSTYSPPEAPDGAILSDISVACGVGSTQTCNKYGSQTCVAGAGLTLALGVWGPCSCPLPPTCTPGKSTSCGNCGTQVCDSCGQASACTDQGLCTPGDRGPDGCYEGEDALCNQSCEWVCP